ncbi:MAG: 2-oxoacid:acceptor oxidoreductase subunit alpha [Candidatus Bathyarchaeia archaeon]
MTELLCRGLRDETVSILIGGEAGQGITRSGSLLGRALMRGGLHVFGTNEYPSLIRGGHNYYLLRTSAREVYSQDEGVDIVIALNKETALLHEAEIHQGGYILVDEATQFAEGELRRGDVRVYRIPFSAIVKELGGPDIMRNTVALGACVSLLGFDHAVLKEVVAATFSKKEVADMNRAAIDRGHAFAREKYYGFNCELNGSGVRGERILPTGNDAVALGAVSAGCGFYAAYPMTPASAILDYMAAHDQETGMVVIQAESEIAAMNMVVGAGYGGVRAMTATSGGGFCLMTEALGLAAMSETPVVVNIGQRPGPSTGLATHSAQGDLLFAIHASQGEFPRVVLAPGDADECFQLTKRAFNLAERFQIPALILTDKYLAESERDTPPFDEGLVPIDRGKLHAEPEWAGGEYKRYELTGDGVSPRAIPGARGAFVVATSNEHRETGYSTSDPEAVVAMVDKRFRKLPHIAEAVSGLETVKTHGDPSAEVLMVGWGGTKGPILEAMLLLEREGVKSRFLQVVFMEPFPAERVREELVKAKTVVLFENNVTAQLGELIRLHTGIRIENTGLRYDGRPFNPSQIKKRVMEVLRT